MELTPEQLVYVGVVASVITQGLRLLAKKFGYNAPREVVTVALFVVAIVLGIWFFGLPEVSNGDPMELATKIIAAAASVLGSAVFIYNVLLDKVLRKA